MTISTLEFDYVRGLLRERAAIVLDPGKEYLVESRLVGVAKKEGFTSLSDLVSALKSQSYNGMHKRVVDAMTTNETSFFRDIHPFDALKKVVIPDLLQKRASTRQLNFWCAASSTGQEPYTVAMIVKENFPQLATWKFQYIATDISTDVLAKARSGLYSRLELNRGLPAQLLVKYFDQKGFDWQANEELRKMIDFRELNLAGTWPSLPAMDVVFIRNVLIYFDVETKKQIFSKIKKILRPDGYLFLGGAETTINIDDQFERVPIEKAGIYRLKS